MPIARRVPLAEANAARKSGLISSTTFAIRTPALRPAIIDAAYGVGFRTVILEGVAQPVAWSRRP